MDTACPYPHLSWCGVWRVVGRARETVEIQMRQTAHCLMYTSRAKAAVRWVHRGREERFRVAAGSVRFSPASDDDHALVGRCNPGHSFYTLLIPHQHLLGVAEAEGIAAVPELRHSVSANDAVLVSCMRTLSARPEQCAEPADDGQEVASLALLLRVMAMNGCRGPDWATDKSVLDRRTVNNLVAYIDENLRVAPSLKDMAMVAGLSPGHFAKKFRRSMGMTPHRFVNCRRIRRSFSLLQEDANSLSRVADELGFSSQSHFTRLFGELTGMTPARCRKQFRRIVG